MSYWIYDNWQAGPHKAVIHVAECGFCKDGRGRSGRGTDPRYGRWLGPYPSLDEAQIAASDLPRVDLSIHRCCGQPHDKLPQGGFSGASGRYWGRHSGEMSKPSGEEPQERPSREAVQALAKAPATLAGSLVLIPCCKRKAAGGTTPWDEEAGAASRMGRCADLLSQARRNLGAIRQEVEGLDLGGEGSSPPLMPAMQRYTGNLYRAADLANWSGSAASAFRHSTLIVSGLYGLVAPSEAIRYYQCAMDERLPTGEQVATWWQRRGLGVWLRAYIAEAGVRRVYSFLPNLYAKGIGGLDFGEVELHHIACDVGSDSMTKQGRRLRQLFLEGRCPCPACSLGASRGRTRYERLLEALQPPAGAQSSRTSGPTPDLERWARPASGPSALKAGVARPLSEAFMRGELDLSARTEKATVGWEGVPEVPATARLRRAGASDAQVRLFLTLTCAMDRARDANRLWRAAADLFLAEPWVFDPPSALAEQAAAAELLQASGVSQRHGPDVEAWTALAGAFSQPEIVPRAWRAVFLGQGDARDLLQERASLWPDGRPLLPMIRGPKVGPMWVRMLAYPGGATLSSLAVIPVAVDVQVRRATENLGVTATEGMELERARPFIQQAWAVDVADHGAAGPLSLEGTCAALDPVLWFFGKYGCSHCEGVGHRVPIAGVCKRCEAQFAM